jgi:hypothetical protein
MLSTRVGCSAPGSCSSRSVSVSPRPVARSRSRRASQLVGRLADPSTGGILINVRPDRLLVETHLASRGSGPQVQDVGDVDVARGETAGPDHLPDQPAFVVIDQWRYWAGTRCREAIYRRCSITTVMSSTKFTEIDVI